jgi:hypothetical protein
MRTKKTVLFGKTVVSDAFKFLKMIFSRLIIVGFWVISKGIMWKPYRAQLTLLEEQVQNAR